MPIMKLNLITLYLLRSLMKLQKKEEESKLLQFGINGISGRVNAE